jgi:hypothetical protein
MIFLHLVIFFTDKKDKNIGMFVTNNRKVIKSQYYGTN